MRGVAVSSLRELTNSTPKRTLTSDSTVESVTLDKDRFGGTLSVSLENVDSLDGIFDVTTSVDSLDSEHSIDSHVGEEGVVAVEHREE